MEALPVVPPTPASARPGSRPPKHGCPKVAPADDLPSFVRDLDRRTLLRKLRLPRCHGEDILQEALLLLVERDADIRPEARDRWLWRTMVHKKLHFVANWGLWRKYADRIEAHVQEQTVIPSWPDSDLLRRQTLKAVFWLVEQVAPTRRHIAELHLFEDLTLEEIAESTKSTLGVVSSRWHRAKEDMRAALDREQAKHKSKPFLVLVAALLVRLWLWAVGRLSERLSQVANWLRSRDDGPSRPISAYSMVRKGPRSSRRSHILGAVVLAALLPIKLISHQSVAALETREEPTTGAIAALTSFVFKPLLFTNAEPEREWVSVPSTTRRAHATPPAPSPMAVSTSRRVLARTYLTRASSALLEGHRDMARHALLLYERGFPENPYPAQHASLAEQLRSP